MYHVRPAAVAGSFYPADAARLAREVDAMLAGVAARDAGPVPKAIVAPHAGYVYSGPVAASAFARLRLARDRLRRVVLLGPAHRARVRGLASPDADALATPLGDVVVDADAIAAIAHLPQVVADRAAHAREHSLEVELPFLQRVLGDFRVLPLCVGGASPEEVEAVLLTLWGGAETAVVVSSDLSHYLPYARAQAIDRDTADRVVGLDAGAIDHERACGATPLAGLVLAARRKGMRAELLDLRNSGDTAGPRDEVVGYGAFAFHEEA